MHHLPEERKYQLKMAHKALDHRDAAERLGNLVDARRWEGVSRAYFWEGIDGFIARIDAMLTRIEGPVTGKPRPTKRAARQSRAAAGPTSIQLAKAERLAKITAHIIANPHLSNYDLANIHKCHVQTASRIKKELGIEIRKGNDRSLRAQYEALFAANPNIRDRDAAKLLNCSRGVISLYHRELVASEHARQSIAQRAAGGLKD